MWFSTSRKMAGNTDGSGDLMISQFHSYKKTRAILSMFSIF